MAEYKITVIEGDGIGPEVVAEGVKCLEAIGKRFGHSFSYTSALLGGCAYDACGTPLPQATLDACRASAAALMGAVGGSKWDTLPADLRPEAGLLQIRSQLGLFANLRPASVLPALSDASPLREALAKTVDLVIVRELIGGIYFGKRGTTDNVAFDTAEYTRSEIERIALRAFDIARKRRHHLTSVDKANVLDTSRLWRKTINELAPLFPDVTVDHLYVDNAAMQLVRNPGQFDVIVTSNLFGDILSDEAAMLTGSIGLLPSASLGESSSSTKVDTMFGLYEPVHGSAPDIAGKQLANPVATILSVAMLLRYSLGLSSEANCVEDGVHVAFENGIHTSDISLATTSIATTSEVGDFIADWIQNT